MSKKDFSTLSKEERAALARQVKPLRLAKGLDQADLAELAGVNRATIISMERGGEPQAKKLKAVLDALGFETHGQFEDQTEWWLLTMGSMIEQIPEPRRETHVVMAIGDLAAGLREPAEYDNVTVLPTNVGGDKETEALRLGAVASDMEDGGIGE